MSHRPTSFSRDIMSRSLCSSRGSRFSLTLPCKTNNSIHCQLLPRRQSCPFISTHPAMHASAFASINLTTHATVSLSAHVLSQIYPAQIYPAQTLWWEPGVSHLTCLGSVVLHVYILSSTGIPGRGRASEGQHQSICAGCAKVQCGSPCHPAVQHLPWFLSAA